MVESEVQNNFDKVKWYYKNQLIWRLLSNNRYKRFVYQGKKKLLTSMQLLNILKLTRIIKIIIYHI